MITSILNRFWPVAPWVTALKRAFDKDQTLFVLEPVWKMYAYEPVEEHEPGDFVLVANDQTKLSFYYVIDMKISVWANGKFVVTSLYEPGGYALNWRERDVLMPMLRHYRDLHWSDIATDRLSGVSAQ